MLRQVADRAMQIAEEAILSFRSHRSSRLENAALLSAAMRLQILVTKCASGADSTDMGGVFEELLARAAQQRFQTLILKCSADAGTVFESLWTHLHGQSLDRQPHQHSGTPSM